MKPFRFRLESVLTLRTWEEERARTAYGQAVAQERRFSAQLREIEARLERDVAACHRAAGESLAAPTRVQQWRHLLALERERTDAGNKLATARRIREQKMKLLLDAHRRVQVLEALRTRQQHAHRAATLAREERELDDLMGARFRATVSPR